MQDVSYNSIHNIHNQLAGSNTHDILIDLAIDNQTIYNGKPIELLSILNSYTFYNIFIVSHPGSYVGIRKALVMTIVQQYTQNIRVYTLNLLQYLQCYDTNAACVVKKHIWHYNQVYSIIGFREPVNITNAPILNYLLPYTIKKIDIEYLWQHRYTIFTLTPDICMPIYVDQFAD